MGRARFEHATYGFYAQWPYKTIALVANCTNQAELPAR